MIENFTNNSLQFVKSIESSAFKPESQQMTIKITEQGFATNTIDGMRKRRKTSPLTFIAVNCIHDNNNNNHNHNHHHKIFEIFFFFLWHKKRNTKI